MQQRFTDEGSSKFLIEVLFAVQTGLIVAIVIAAALVLLS